MGVPALHYRADLPGHELVLAIAVLFALAGFSGSSGNDQLEDALAHLLKAAAAVNDLAAIDIDIILLALLERGVGR